MRNNSRFRSSTVIGAVAVIVVIGYFLIFFSTVFGTTNQIKRLESEIAATNIQLDMYRKKLAEKEKEAKQVKPLITQKPDKVQPSLHTPAVVGHSVRHGVIILGMHRSGTSLVGGLVNKMGLKTGGPLIQAAEDNAKGFFERIDVVLQNDYIMHTQNVHYASQTYRYNALQGLKRILNDDGSWFKEGNRGLKFLNDPSNYPWMLKDPRLCITFRTWLPLLNFYPAILFTYRHPLDVAMSLHKREFERFEIARGLRMWYVYNKRAVQQSDDLCRVVSSHRLVMQQPKVEFDRIFEQLKACGVDVPHQLNDQEISSFIDIKLQHGKSTLTDKVCEENLEEIQPPESWQTTDPAQLKLYREVMRVYCAMENRSAFENGFKWDESIHD
jgi:hypothetical protein